MLTAIFFSCRYVNIENFYASSKNSYRCGIYHSFIYANTVEQEVYPDLGMVLEHKKELNLNAEEENKILQKSRDCFEKCTIKKELLRLKEEEIKSQIIKTNKKDNIQKITKIINSIQQEKLIWLKEHQKRYLEGLKLLSPEQLEKWIIIEKTARAFPKIDL
ncbi:MAG: hypothetical protein OEZ22_10485 [Spirochaetia bacterium]|nr:hypothetical protein [Spirochaetia bacterium]